MITEVILYHQHFGNNILFVFIRKSKIYSFHKKVYESTENIGNFFFSSNYRKKT